MATKKPLEPGTNRESISDSASDWIRQFIKHLELNYVDSSQRLRPNASTSDYQDATIRATLQTFVDSGMDFESVVEAIGRISIERHSGSIEWTSKLNQRRFSLIDKEIQGTLTVGEKVELAGLTRMMREQLDSEVNLPMDGAKALHRKLLELDVRDKGR